MPPPDYFEIFKTLGFPVALAAILLWLFIWTSKKQTNSSSQLLNQLSETQSAQNTKLLQQVERLSETSQSLVHAMEVNDRLMKQNERLVEAINSKEDAFIKLLQAINANERGAK